MGHGPEYAESQYRKYTPGVLAATIFVVDPTTKKILCRAPLRAQQEGTLRVTTDDRNTMNNDFIGRINLALTDAKVAIVAPDMHLTLFRISDPERSTDACQRSSSVVEQR